MSDQIDAEARIVVTGGSGFIGTNLVQKLLLDGIEVLSLDIKPPQLPDHGEHFLRCDILEVRELEEAFRNFAPTAVVHLAARTDLVEGDDLSCYAANIAGVRNVLHAVNHTPSIRRVLFTSTKLVNKNGATGVASTNYNPDTLYGKSKMAGEQIVRDNPPSCAWAILRPTSIWGPWFGVPYKNFFVSILRRFYVHVMGCDLPKRFGYVGNTVFQIQALLNCPAEAMQGGTFYLADYYVTSIRSWADEISMQLRNKKNLKAPDWLIRLGAECGDVAKRCGMADPPLSSFRLRNMCTPTAEASLDNCMAVSGALPYSQADGVRLTLEWLTKR
jgi:GlcNAc-P-P-Und epimerase